jgi:PHD-zinc-finger like domain
VSPDKPVVSSFPYAGESLADGKPKSCVLCPAEFGAFKQTTTGSWAHLLCAIWVPETGVANVIYMEPVDGVDAIPKNRWKLVSARSIALCILLTE